MELRFVDGWDMRWKIFRTSSGRGDAWIGVPVQCYMECNSISIYKLGRLLIFCFY